VAICLDGLASPQYLRTTNLYPTDESVP